MKKTIFILAAIVLLFQFSSKADEGMWLLSLINKNYADMKKQGFKLTPDDIYNINKACIKDAIVIFGGGCTGEIVSNNGLVLTNHHCGYGSIQSKSTVEHNYLRDGFWAKNYAEELPISNLSVTFFIRMEDVTKQVLAKVTDNMTDEERQKAIMEAGNEISKKAEENGKYKTDVRSFFDSNSYYLLVYEVYNDVRLVGTPPESIGNFGSDTDNWMWPRHTGDFSVFRVYMSPDGKPAAYSDKNVPLKPKYSLPVSIKGVKKGDFTMIIGFPGRTNRYLTSYGVDELMNITNVNRIKIRGIRQDIWMADMKADEKIHIQYSSKYKGSSNYWKYSIGENKGLTNLNVKANKQAIEEKFRKWVAQDPARQTKYGQALTLLENAYNSRKDYTYVSQYIQESLLGIEIFSFASRAGRMADAPDRLKDFAINNFFKNYNMSTDKKVAEAMIKLYMTDVKEEFQPDFIIKEVKGTFGGNVSAYVEDLFSKSIFASEEKFSKFMETFDKAKLQEDPAAKASASVIEIMMKVNKSSEQFDKDIAKGRRLFLAGLMEMDKTRNFYPDANSTMRLTYGTVGDYRPKDGVIYDYVTTLDGVIEKEIPGDFEFDVSPRLKELWKNKDYGVYGQNGKLVTCFTSNNDITGGNSGSPILNGNGELIGLAFDGNWEAMSGNIAFEPALQKTINVDIRYVLWVMDKFAGAKHLVDEMKIVK
ncbi:MAG: S46 family peptidase [Bacteroidales bacterium]